jgi:hypothetical protein
MLGRFLQSRLSGLNYRSKHFRATIDDRRSREILTLFPKFPILRLWERKLERLKANISDQLTTFNFLLGLALYFQHITKITLGSTSTHFDRIAAQLLLSLHCHMPILCLTFSQSKYSLFIAMFSLP